MYHRPSEDGCYWKASAPFIVPVRLNRSRDNLPTSHTYAAQNPSAGCDSNSELKPYLSLFGVALVREGVRGSASGDTVCKD